MSKSKRVSIRGMGADAFFSPPPQPNSSPQKPSTPDTQTYRAPETQTPSKTEIQRTGKPERQQWVKATYLLSPHHITALEELQLTIRKKTKKRVDKSALIREAIDSLVKGYQIRP